MKISFYKTMAFWSMMLMLFSCKNSDDEVLEDISGTGNLVLEFDNRYSDANLILGTQENTNSLGEKLKTTKLKYIVSNITLTKEDGSVYTYPKEKSYFIVDEATGTEITLENIPAGNYKSVQFGIGVDKAQWELGADGQGDFLAKAQTAGMMWSWTAGYKFLAFEGTFKGATSTDVGYKVHTGKTMVDGVENYNYFQTSLALPEKALVRTTISPAVHIFADVSKILDGKNKISLEANNPKGTGASIMGGANLPKIIENMAEMFSADHVHND